MILCSLILSSLQTHSAQNPFAQLFPWVIQPQCFGAKYLKKQLKKIPVLKVIIKQPSINQMRWHATSGKVVMYLFPEEQLYSLQQLKMNKGSPSPPPTAQCMCSAQWSAEGNGEKDFATPFSGEWERAVLWMDASQCDTGCRFCHHSLHQCLGLRLGLSREGLYSTCQGLCFSTRSLPMRNSIATILLLDSPQRNRAQWYLK